MSNIFEHDYQILELDREADWKDARESYRRLVNRWHPDRFTARPREKQHAQSRFIEVTKAYNNLRGFHREHSRLPLQDPALRDGNNSTGTPPEPSIRPGKPGKASVGENPFAAESAQKKAKKPRYWLWAIPILGLLAVVVLFAALDNRLGQQTRENGIEVLRDTKPSEFMPKR